MKVLVTGGVRSGKSRHAESLVSSSEPMTYVAAGPSPDTESDPDWTARVAAHRARRPGGWRTLETRDLSAAFAMDGPVLVDCLGTWLNGIVDERSLWDAPTDDVAAVVTGLVDAALAALAARDAGRPTVIVTNEVGLGVVPEHRSGRLFRDLLGLVNQQVAAACDEVHLVIAGRVLVL